MTELTACYDLDRAAQAGGFEDDLVLGREVARRLHAALKARTVPETPVNVDAVLGDTLTAVEDLWEPIPEHERGMWAAAMSNALVDMLRDVRAQTREALAKP